MDTKTALLDHAEAAARSRGYDGFSYADLANAVGIRKASVHHHFPTKTDLAIALVERYVERVAEQLEAVTDEGNSAAQRLSAFIDTYRAALDGGSKMCLCVSFSAGSESLDPAVLARINAFHDMAEEWLAAQFMLAQADGSIGNVRDPESEAIACLAQVEGAQLIGRAARDVGRFDAAMASLTARLA